MSLKNAHIVVIGGSSEMGLAIVQQAACEHAHVIVASRSRERLEQAHTQITGEVALEEESVQTLFARIGTLDHLVVTASDGASGTIEAMDLNEVRHVMESKFWGQLLVARHGGPYISKHGSLTLFSGDAGWKPSIGSGVLSAANAAVGVLGQTLALELVPVRVNVISPGLIDTPAYAGMPKQQREAMYTSAAQHLPVGRVGTPDDIASIVIHVMQNGFMSGTIVHVDGGALL